MIPSEIIVMGDKVLNSEGTITIPDTTDSQQTNW